MASFNSSIPVPVATAAAAGVVTLAVAASLYRSRQPDRPSASRVLRSPLPLSPDLAGDDASGSSAAAPQGVVGTAYSPDSLPGGRTVDTPYGRIRAYEWGPEGGKKVLFVHGITTPCIGLRGLAGELAKRGYRVCVFDLFGRGYSDAPLDIPYDARLYSSQIMLVLASSPISWTGAGSGGFSIIGWSLGGGVTMSFAARFPELVNSVVLLASGGLFRAILGAYGSIIFKLAGYLPESLVSIQLRRLLIGNLPYSDPKGADNVEMSGADQAAAVLEGKDLSLDAGKVIKWQFENHNGFIHAFVSSLINAPLKDQHHDWRRVGRICEQNREKRKNGGDGHQGYTKILGIVGSADTIALPNDFLEDAPATVGPDNMETFVIEGGGHDFPVRYVPKVADRICEFWATS